MGTAGYFQIPEYEGLLFWSKGLVWHAGNTGVWLRWISAHQKLAFLSFDSSFKYADERPPKQFPTSSQHVATCTQGTSWSLPAALGVQLEVSGTQGISDGMLGIGRGGMAGKRQDITQGCAPDCWPCKYSLRTGSHSRAALVIFQSLHWTCQWSYYESKRTQSATRGRGGGKVAVALAR
eukprot:1138808-Pelagomonas_calceolata.AAC.3